MGLMSDGMYIPEKTRDLMASGATKGNRHDAMFKIGMSLLGQGMSPDAVFAQIRATIPDPDKTDREIRDVIQWCLQKNPTPAGYSDSPPPQTSRPAKQWTAPQKPAEKPLPPQEAVRRCIGDAWMSEASWAARCKTPLPVDPKEQMRTLLLALYEPTDRVNIVGRHFIGDDGKAKPHGGGKSLTRDEWMDYIADKGVPKSEAGVWVRPNPCGDGTGKDGAIQDADIMAWRFAFLESDILSTAEQLSFYARTGLPIAAIITSGGEASCHAWVRIDAKSLDEYRERVKALYAVVEAYGMDKANKNASRLSRLPGAHRTIGGHGDGYQRLLYVNGDCRGDVITDEFLERMAISLRKPPPSKTPLMDAMFAAADRYDDLIKNKGKTGLMNGLESFDRMSGGLKKKRMYVIAAESKCGKSTLGFNIVNHVSVRNGLPVAMFSMEMDKDEIVDILVAMNGSVDRNVFNTGNFFGNDAERSLEGLKKIGNAPLHIFDNPIMTTADMRSECLRLKAETDIALVVCDYVQLCTPTPETMHQGREQQVAAMGKDLRALCKDVDAPVIVISQINDEGKLRESRSLAHAAHAVLLLEEMDPTNTGIERELKLKIERARGLPRGEFPILFEVLYSRMSDGKHSTEKRETVKQGDFRKQNRR